MRTAAVRPTQFGVLPRFRVVLCDPFAARAASGPAAAEPPSRVTKSCGRPGEDRTLSHRQMSSTLCITANSGADVSDGSKTEIAFPGLTVRSPLKAVISKGL